MDDLGFPLWLRANHYLNLLFLSLLIRSGLQILADKPKLFWNDSCKAGTEWLTFNKKADSKAVNSVVALPGGNSQFSLELGRTWHALSVLFWVGNGICYVVLLALTNEWHRLVPNSFAVFPQAVAVLFQYLTFSPPATSVTGHYNALQQLTYFALIFICAPLSIVTGAAISPKIASLHPWYPGLFGGRQAARSLHYLLLVFYLLFTMVHVSLVVSSDLLLHMNRIVLGSASQSINGGQSINGLTVGCAGLVGVLLLHWLATIWSLKQPEIVEQRLARPKRLLITDSRELSPDSDGEASMALSDDELREKIRKLMVEDKLETQMAPFPEDNVQFDAILKELRALDPNDLTAKLVISGFAPEPVEDQRCLECMYYQVHRKWCDIPELDLPVEPEWWCRLWRI